MQALQKGGDDSRGRDVEGHALVTDHCASCVTVRSPCLSINRVLGFLKEVVPKKEVDHVGHHVLCL